MARAAQVIGGCCMTKELYLNLSAEQADRVYELLKEAYRILGGGVENMYAGGSIADYTSRALQYASFERSFTAVRGAMLEAVRDYTHKSKAEIVTVRAYIPHDIMGRIEWSKPWETTYRIGDAFYTCTMVVDKGVPAGQPEVHVSTDEELRWIMK